MSKIKSFIYKSAFLTQLYKNNIFGFIKSQIIFFMFKYIQDWYNKINQVFEKLLKIWAKLTSTLRHYIYNIILYYIYNIIMYYIYNIKDISVL